MTNAKNAYLRFRRIFLECIIWNVDHTEMSEFDKLSLSNNISKFGFVKIQSKVTVKNLNPLKDISIGMHCTIS